MKLCCFRLDGSVRTGVKAAAGIIDLTALGFPAEMNEIIRGGEAMLGKIRAAAESCKGTVLAESDIEFLPVSNPKKIVCEGLNFKKHAEETGGTAPKHPVFFSKFYDTLSAHNKETILPAWNKKYDYEAELVIVVGKYSYNLPSPEAARENIFGYTCGNDLSARDCQFLSSQWLSGKSFPGFAPTGPYIATCDEFDPEVSHGIFCEVNGVTVQSSVTTDMIFNCAETLYTASKFFPLDAGDLIFTGTPEGVIQGRERDKRVWLKPGDIVRVSIDGIGTLVTPLV